MEKYLRLKAPVQTWPPCFSTGLGKFSSTRQISSGTGAETTLLGALGKIEPPKNVWNKKHLGEGLGDGISSLWTRASS